MAPTRANNSGADSSIPTRWSLIKGLQGECDQDAWREFYATYRGVIYGMALKCGLPPEDADVAVQNTMTSVFEKMPEFEARPSAGSFRSWLCRLAHWRILNLIEQRRLNQRWHSGQRAKHVSEETATTATIDRVPLPDPDAEKLWDEEWREHLTEMALAKLKRRVKAKHYQVFYLYTIKASSAADVARIVSVSKAQVHLISFRLKRVFKRVVATLKGQSSR